MHFQEVRLLANESQPTEQHPQTRQKAGFILNGFSPSAYKKIGDPGYGKLNLSRNCFCFERAGLLAAPLDGKKMNGL
jgi:hypothetical protein